MPLNYQPVFEVPTMTAKAKNWIRVAVVLALLAAAYLVGYDGGYRMGRADEMNDAARGIVNGGGL